MLEHPVVGRLGAELRSKAWHAKDFPTLGSSHVQEAKFVHKYTPKSTTRAMPSTHKKDKPWDTDDIDKWKVNLQKLYARDTNR
jgi:hypothetical protein